jgi:site-specific recombinase XerD
MDNRALDAELTKLMDQIRSFYKAFRADNTVRQHSYAFNSFCKWCFSHNIVNILPFSDVYVAMYLMHLANKGKSVSTLNKAYYDICWTHKLAGVADPCTSDLVISMKEWALRSTGRFTIRKEPITPDIIKNIVATYGKARADLTHLRIACMCRISCAGFLQYSELSNLRRDNLTFDEQYVKLFLEGSKTDVYRAGRDVLISKTNSNNCPVNTLLRYLSSADIMHDSTDFIFRPLSFCKSSGTYILRKGKLSYTTLRETMLSAHEIGIR